MASLRVPVPSGPPAGNNGLICLNRLKVVRNRRPGRAWASVSPTLANSGAAKTAAGTTS